MSKYYFFAFILGIFFSWSFFTFIYKPQVINSNLALVDGDLVYLDNSSLELPKDFLNLLNNSKNINLASSEIRLINKVLIEFIREETQKSHKKAEQIFKNLLKNNLKRVLIVKTIGN